MQILYPATSNQALHTQKDTRQFWRKWGKKGKNSPTVKTITQITTQKRVLMSSSKTPTCPCIMETLLAIVSLLTSHARVSAEATVELTMDQSSVEKPLSKQMEDAVDLWPCRGR